LSIVLGRIALIPEFLGHNGPDADMMPTGLPQRWT
jgi:hypothetical protein